MDELDHAHADPHGGHRYEVEAMMLFPFLALGEGRTKLIRFPDKSGQITHTVETDRAQGMAFIEDLNVLIWVITELRERIHVGGRPRRDLVLSIARSDLLRFIGRERGGRQWKLLDATLERLCKTRVTTNLPRKVTGGEVQTFTLLEDCSWGDAADPVLTLVPPQWLVDVVGNRDAIMRVNPASMRLTGIERCIYRYARARVPPEICSPVLLDPARAVDRFGSMGRAAGMRFKLKKLVKELERAEALRSNGTATDETDIQDGKVSKRDRPVIIPDYIVTASATDGIAMEFDPDALPCRYRGDPRPC